MTKRCPQCGEEKTLNRRNFVVVKRKSDGRLFWKHCRACDHKRQAEQRAKVRADPERRKAYAARHRESERRRYKANPEKYRAYQREWRARLKEEHHDRYVDMFLIPRRFARGEKSRLQRAKTHEAYVAPSRKDAVPAEPFRTWLEEHYAGWTLDEIAREAGYALMPRRLFALYHEQDAITLDAVDRFFTRGLARPDLVNALYPFEGATA